MMIKNSHVNPQKMIDVTVDLQVAVDDDSCPTLLQFEAWASALCQFLSIKVMQVSLRLVDAIEGKQLNQQWRNKPNATNVLSFPFEMPEVELNFLGDIVLCVPVVLEEAQQQQKTVEAHFAHLWCHGLLHLLGYDHVESQDAMKMEQQEIEIMQRLGYSNPYDD